MALYEPAILFIIFENLPPLDLLLVQRTCRAWRNTVISDNRLLAQIWLRAPPVRLSPDLTVPAAQPEMNPLLSRHFPDFLNGNRWQDNSATGWGNLGPWCHATMLKGYGDKTLQPSGSFSRLEKYLYPEASWRKMIPCRPMRTELQINFKTTCDQTSSTSTLRCLCFRNLSGDAPISPTKRTTTPTPWLTFGMLYDLVEAVWFRERPQPISSGIIRWRSDTALWPSEAAIIGAQISGKVVTLNDPKPKTQDVRAPYREIKGPDRVYVDLFGDMQSLADRADLRDAAKVSPIQPTYRGPLRIQARESQSASSRAPPNRHETSFDYAEPFKSMVFENEVHVEGGLEFDDIEWDEIHHVFTNYYG